MFSPSRLRVARKRRGLNRSGLAGMVGVDMRSITGFERGEYAPRPDTLGRIARALDFPEPFFQGPDLHEPAPSTASFRALSRLSSAARERALATAALAFLLADWLDERFDLPPPDLPDLAREEPEAAAMALRRHWAMGEAPARHMIHLLEARGARVFSLGERTGEGDAFSLWRGPTPFLFLNTARTAEAARFDAAHELGHLVLHRHGSPRGRDAEAEADRFAAAFLMPSGSILAHAPRLITPERLLEMKGRWIVSAAVLAARLRALGLVGEWQHRALCADLAARGWLSAEPDPAPREGSQLLAKVLVTLRGEGVGKADVARAIHIDERELDRLLSGLALVALGGAG